MQKRKCDIYAQNHSLYRKFPASVAITTQTSSRNHNSSKSQQILPQVMDKAENKKVQNTENDKNMDSQYHYINISKFGTSLYKFNHFPNYFEKK